MRHATPCRLIAAASAVPGHTDAARQRLTARLLRTRNHARTLTLCEWNAINDRLLYTTSVVGVKRTRLATGPGLLYPQQRDLGHNESEVCWCHNRTFACSLNYLIGTRDERRRYGKPQLLGYLEVDGQLEFGHLVERDVAGLCS
jgi:hypothetical protein